MSWMRPASEAPSEDQLAGMATRARVEILRLWAKRRGPLAGQFSVVELYISLFCDVLDIDAYVADEVHRPRIVPKGTGAFALYASAAFAGLIDVQALRLGKLPPVPERHILGDVSPHKMGMSFEQGIGLALASMYRGTGFPVIVFLSDGGFQPGIDHAAKFAARMRLSNLTLLVDVNALQSHYRIDQVDPTFAFDASGRLDTQQRIFEAYGWRVFQIDGHDFAQIGGALRLTGEGDQPLLILARTVKGKGLPCIENSPCFSHNLPPDVDVSSVEAMLVDGRELPECPQRVRNPARTTTIGRRPPLLPDVTPHPKHLVRDFLQRWLRAFLKLNPTAVIINTDNPFPFDRMEPVLDDQFRSRLIQAGINERFALNIAAGLANEGMLPIYIGPAAHMPAISEDFKFLALDQQPVVVISINPGSTASHWGPAHLVYEDIDIFRAPNANVFQPANAWDCAVALEDVLEGLGRLR